MIGRAHHPKTIVVPLIVGVVVVTSGAAQILCRIVPRAATKSPRLYSDSSPPGHESQVLVKSKEQKAKSKRQHRSCHSAGIFFELSIVLDSKKIPAE
jgi:hypothetical protein